MDTPSLKEFQRLFVQTINSVEGIPPPIGLCDRIAPGGTLKAEAALGVYQTGYRVRLTEALGETYEAVWWVTGDTNFFRLAKDYLALHPSSFYNLSDVGKAFPAFLENLFPFADLPFLADLARFEWLFQEVFHSSPHHPLSSERLAHTNLSGDTRLGFGSSLRLFTSPYSVYEIWKLRSTPQAPIPQDSWSHPQDLLAYQHQHQVYIQRLSPMEYDIVKLLIDGNCIGEALHTAMVIYPDLSPQVVSNLFAFMKRDGLITEIADPSSSQPSFV